MTGAVKITDAQWRMLDRICRTNGAGVSAWSLNNLTLQALYSRDLVQGKSGQQYMVVRTREGLKLWREVEQSNA